MSQPFRLSVAVPLYNEESVLPEFLRRIRVVLECLAGGPHELVLVDDGSADRTLALLEAEAASNPGTVVVSLSRNFGHQAARTALWRPWKQKRRMMPGSSWLRYRETSGIRLP